MKYFNFTRHQWIIFIFSFLYVAGFSTYYIASANYEFLWYVGVMLFFFVLLVATLPVSRFTPLILWGLSLWGLAHMAGGSIPVGDTVLYGVQLITVFTDGELTLVKYDQVVHAFGFAIATLVAHHLLAPRWKEGASKALKYALAAGVGMGLGALNEVVEFIAVLSFPETGVGGYFNTGLDLMANLVGVLIAVGFLAYRDRNK